MNIVITKLAAAGAASVAALAARRAVEEGWRWFRGEEPPSAGDVSDDRDLGELLLWSTVLTVSVVVAKKLAASKAEQLLGADEEG